MVRERPLMIFDFRGDDPEKLDVRGVGGQKSFKIVGHH